MLDIAGRFPHRRQFGGHDDRNLVRRRNAGTRPFGQRRRAIDDEVLKGLREKGERVLHRRSWRTINRVYGLGRIEELKSGIMLQEKAFQQVFVEAISIAGKLVKAVLVPARAEI